MGKAQFWQQWKATEARDYTSRTAEMLARIKQSGLRVRLVSQIHDEFDFECHPDDQAKFQLLLEEYAR